MQEGNKAKGEAAAIQKPVSADLSALISCVHNKVVSIRDIPVILDADVAELYGVETKRVNEAVRNNKDKFPEDYMFELSREESQVLRT